VLVYGHAADWSPSSIIGLGGAIEISGIAVTLPLADISANIPFSGFAGV
jgi:hypothetical protein